MSSDESDWREECHGLSIVYLQCCFKYCSGSSAHIEISEYYHLILTHTMTEGEQFYHMDVGVFF